ncbi:MAG: GNAT family N-acetyltransferase [Rubripirellula sp.]
MSVLRPQRETHVSVLVVQTSPLTQLEALLPRLLQNVSLSRAQIAIDQLRGTIGANGQHRILLITASPQDSPESPLAAVIAIQQPEPDNRTATILHAAATVPVDREQQTNLITAMKPILRSQLSERGVTFLQWATDIGPNEGVTDWCDGFGFQPMATLDYLSGEVPLIRKDPSSKKGKAQVPRPEPENSLQFIPVNTNAKAVGTDGKSDGCSEYKSFVTLVNSTYSETLDCPALAEHRTAQETLNGYRTAAAFAPTGWFRVVRSEGTVRSECAGRQTTVGCVILGYHPPPPDQSETPGVVEIVYMGIVPSARGLGLGRDLVEHAFAVARNHSADRLILAVDQKNEPARRIYEAAGLTPMLSEMVWVKSLSESNSEPTD